LDVASAKQIAVLRGHERGVPDGSRIVIACVDKTARLWNVARILLPRKPTPGLPSNFTHANAIFTQAARKIWTPGLNLL
jgi:hypothetical protein